MALDPKIEEKLAWMNVDPWDSYVWLAEHILRLEGTIKELTEALITIEKEQGSMNKLLKSKTLYKRGHGVELFQGGEGLWCVKVYEITSGKQISTGRFSKKSTAESYYDDQEDE